MVRDVTAPPAGTIYRSYYYAAGKRVAMRVQEGYPNQTENHLYYILSDHLGSTSMLIKEDGTVEESYEYGPWGERNPTGGELPDDPITDYGYTGQRKDNYIYL